MKILPGQFTSRVESSVIKGVQEHNRRIFYKMIRSITEHHVWVLIRNERAMIIRNWARNDLYERMTSDRRGHTTILKREWGVQYGSRIKNKDP